MKLPKLRAKKENKRNKSFDPNSFKHLREKNTRKRRFKIPRIKITFNKRFKRFILKFGIVTIFIIVTVGLIFFSNIFLVSSIQINTNSEAEIDKSPIENEFMEKNIFTFLNSDVLDSINNNYEEVRSAYVRKILPGKIEIEIVFEEPYFYIYDLFEYRLVNSFGETIETGSFDKEFEIDSDELLAFKGIKNLNLKQIRDPYIKELTEEEREDFDWEDDVSEEVKNELWQEYKAGIDEKYNSHINSITKSLKRDVSKVLFIGNFSDKDLNLSKNYSDATYRVLKKFESIDVEINSLKWEDINRLKVESESGTFIFGIAGKSLDEQFELLERVESQGIEGSVYDFRSNTFVIE